MLSWRSRRYIQELSGFLVFLFPLFCERWWFIYLSVRKTDLYFFFYFKVRVESRKRKQVQHLIQPLKSFGSRVKDIHAKSVSLAVTRASDCEAYFFLKKKKSLSFHSFWALGRNPTSPHLGVPAVESVTLVISKQRGDMSIYKRKLTGDVKKEQDISERKETLKK